jgi:HPr kinase/phosphorylase
MAISVSDFYDAAREKAALELVTGKRGLGRLIHEPAIHRPGLALAGFFRYFALHRIQVLGMAEHEYLLAMSLRQRRHSLRRLFQQRIPCLVIARNRKVWPEILKLARATQVPVLRTPMITGAFINVATVIMENLMAPRDVLQGTMVDIMGIGVLIEGKPGIGNSEVALTLIERGHSLVADDVTVVHRTDDRTLVGTSPEITRYHMEIRGMGIIHVPSLFGVASVHDEKTLDLIVTLRKMEELEDGGRTLVPQVRNVLGVSIPHLTVPVAPGRELANLIEAATLNEKLKRLGHDAAKELDEKLIAAMTRKSKPA